MSRLVCSICKKTQRATKKAHHPTKAQCSRLARNLYHTSVKVQDGAFGEICARSCRVDKSLDPAVSVRSVLVAIGGENVVHHGTIVHALARRVNGTLPCTFFSKQSTVRDAATIQRKVVVPTVATWREEYDAATGLQYYVSLTGKGVVWEGRVPLHIGTHPICLRALSSGVAQVILDEACCTIVHLPNNAVSLKGPDCELASVRELLMELLSEARTTFLLPRTLSGRGVHPSECPVRGRDRQKRR